MRFHTKQHNYYCGIDLHTRTMYICILDSKGQVVLHENMKANPKALAKTIKPFRDELSIAVECTFAWYWVADFCEDNNIPFVLGHALYMKAIHGGKAKNDKIDSYKMRPLKNSFSEVYHLIARSRHGLVVQMLAGLITYFLLAIYCRNNYNEKLNIKRVRELRIKIKNEAPVL